MEGSNQEVTESLKAENSTLKAEIEVLRQENQRLKAALEKIRIESIEARTLFRTVLQGD